MRYRLSVAFLSAVLFGIAPASATTVLVPQDNGVVGRGRIDYSKQLAGGYTVGVMGGNSATNIVFQTSYAASSVAVPIGSTVTAMGLRLAGNSSFTRALSYSAFNVQIGQSTNAIGSLSQTFAANQAADTVLARSGALSFTTAQLNASNNKAFLTITFDTPYVYTGGDLLLTMMIAPTDPSRSIYLDAVPGTVRSSVVTSSIDGAYRTNGSVGGFNFPVLQLTYTSPVPEPMTWAMMLAGFGAIGTVSRRQRRSGAAVRA